MIIVTFLFWPMMAVVAVFCFVLFCFVLFCFVLFCFVLFCFVLFCFSKWPSNVFSFLHATVQLRGTCFFLFGNCVCLGVLELKE